MARRATRSPTTRQTSKAAAARKKSASKRVTASSAKGSSTARVGKAPKKKPLKRKAPRTARRRRPDPARVECVLEVLEEEYGDAVCALTHDNPLQLLVATILSAQCTDERVNKVTADLFRKYRTAEDYASAPPGELEQDIRSTGFFNSKAKNIRGAALRLVEHHDGVVPDTMEELLQLPGVARKTANVVLGVAFGITAGVVVDTHVSRISNLLQFTREKDPVKIERDLMEILPAAEWVNFSHRIIWHGRRVCIARRPKCADCGLNEHCPSSEV